jgi:negative regulator of flagellin synthesis FlgM
MKIGSNNTPDSQGAGRSAKSASGVQKPAAAEQTGKSSQAKGSSPEDRVNISGRSKEIADIMTSVNKLPDVREARVQEIKQQVDAGTYTVDPQKVAESILKNI